MSRPIWQIGLYDKKDKDIVECLECKKMLKLSDGSVKGLKTHLFGKHKGSEFTEKYTKIEGKSKHPIFRERSTLLQYKNSVAHIQQRRFLKF